MELFSMKQPSAAGSRALVNNEELRGSHTAQERHSEATETRPSLLLRPRKDKWYVPSLLHLVAATITSLAVVYLLLRCFEKTLSQGQGAAFRLLGSETNGAEDECVWIPELDEDEQAENNDQGTSPAGSEALPVAPGTSSMVAPSVAYSAGAPWGYEMPATLGAAGWHIRPNEMYTGAVEGNTGEDTMLMGVEEEFESGGGRLGSSGNNLPREIDALTMEEINMGFWQNRLLPQDSKEQLRRLLDNVRSHACACYELLPHIGSRQMLRFTVAVMKILSMQLGVLSLTPDSAMEDLRKQAGWAVVDLGNRALELGGTDPKLQHHREDVADMLLFTLAVLNPRPPGECLSPEKYKIKILGVLGFSVVVNWHVAGIVMGMQYHVSKLGSPLPNEFVGNQIHLLHILQRHQAGRVVHDTKARWYCVYCQILIHKMLFFNPEQLRRASQTPISSVAEFSKNLEEDIKKAGGLPCAPLHDVKYIHGAPETGVRVGRFGDYLLLHFEGDEGDTGARESTPAIAACAKHQRMPDMPASPTPPPGEESTWEFESSQDQRGIGSFPGSWHSPWTRHQATVAATWNILNAQHHTEPQYQVSHLQASAESAVPDALQREQTVLPTLRSPYTDAEWSLGQDQEKTSPAPLTPPPWDPSSAEDFRGGYGNGLHRQVPTSFLRTRYSDPWDNSESEQQTTTPFQQLSPATATERLRLHTGFGTPWGQPQETTDPTPGTQHPAYLPADEFGATDMSTYLQQGSALSEEPPGAPVPHVPHQVSFWLERWAHSEPIQETRQPSRHISRVERQHEVEGQGKTRAAHARLAPGFGGHVDASRTLPPHMEEDRSPPSQPFFLELPKADAEPHLSSSPPHTFDRLILSFASPSQTSSQRHGTTAPHILQQPFGASPDALHRRFEQVGRSSEADSPEPMIGRRSRRPVLPSPSAESAGFAVSPTAQHGSAAGMGQVEGALEALVAKDTAKNEMPPGES